MRQAEQLEQGVKMICLVGFMRILSPGFVETWHGRLLNVHPALLPAFKGLHTRKWAVKFGVRLHGYTARQSHYSIDFKR